MPNYSAFDLEAVRSLNNDVDGDVLWNLDNEATFRDAALRILSSADGLLNIIADTALVLDAPEIRINEGDLIVLDSDTTATQTINGLDFLGSNVLQIQTDEVIQFRINTAGAGASIQAILGESAGSQNFAIINGAATTVFMVNSDGNVEHTAAAESQYRDATTRIFSSATNTLDIEATVLINWSGAGPYCDGQILVLHDILGIGLKTKFSQDFLTGFQNGIPGAIDLYVQQVKSGEFPSLEQSFS